MTNWAQGIQRRRFDLVRRVTIEAVGEYAGLWSFYDRTPSYLSAGELALCKPWLVKGSLPKKFPEDGNPLGGADVGGAITFAITDGLGARAGGTYNGLTRHLGIDAPPDFELTNAGGINSGLDVGVVVEGTAAKIALITALSTVLFAGAEAWLVTAVTASTATTKTLSLTRAALGTEAQAHDERAGVYLYVPFVGGRRIRVYVGLNISTFSQAAEKEMGPGWRVDGDEMIKGLGAYSIRGTSALSTINRQAYSKVFNGTVGQISGDADESFVRLALPADVLRDGRATDVWHFNDGIFLLHGNEEVVMASAFDATHAPESVIIDRNKRAMIGTKRTPFEQGESVQQVFCAWGADNKSSLAFQEPGTETSSRGTGTWIRDERCEHPVVGALNLILSSATPGNKDGLVCTNWVAGSGNFSGLPGGGGAGIPIGEVDHESAHRLWFRTLDWKIPHLRFDRAAPTRELLAKEILQLTGILLTIKNGKLYFDLPSSPVIGATGVSFTARDILTERIAPGVEESRLTDRAATELGAPTVQFVTRKPGGGDHTININDADYPQLTGFIRSKFGQSIGTIKIEARGVPADRGGAARMLEQVGLRHLTKFRRPPREHVFTTDFSRVDDADIGTQALLSHPDLVDRRNRTRGVENLVIWIRSKVPDLELGEVEWKALSFAIAGRYGLNPPSAIITNVVGNVATVRQNRYTDPSAPSSLNIPNRDCDGFATTNVCILRDRAGAIVSGATTQAISAIVSGANTIEFDGNFGGALAVGRVITWAAYDQCTAAQQLSYTFFADTATLGLGAAEIAANTWGER